MFQLIKLYVSGCSVNIILILLSEHGTLCSSGAIRMALVPAEERLWCVRVDSRDK